MAQRDQSTTTETETRRRLEQIPNVGPAVARDLMRLGVTDLADLTGQDPDELYRRLCTQDGICHDPCMLDTLTAIVAYANGAPAQPRWVFSRLRKARTQR